MAAAEPPSRAGGAIDERLVTSLLAEQFPRWAALPVRAVEPGGWDNRSFRLGEDMLVRLLSAAAHAPQVAKEQRWLPRLPPGLPLPIPTPRAMGRTSSEFPWHGSIYGWVEGEHARSDRIAEIEDFANRLADFLAALQAIDPTGGPPPGPENFFRGGDLRVYDSETREAIARLARSASGSIDVEAVTALWNEALASTWTGPPVWLHGDLAADNLLVSEGRLAAVIDFGGLAVGDPACDLSIAWTLLAGPSREAFRAALRLDDDTWVRGRGWTPWKALITLAEHAGGDRDRAGSARRTIEAVLRDDGRARLDPVRRSEQGGRS